LIQPVLADAPVGRVVNHSVSYRHASEIPSRVVMREVEADISRERT